MSASGIVGRMVSCDVTRGEVTKPEVCEVVACTAAGDSGTWRMLVATHDGTLLSAEVSRCTLVPKDSPGGPYR